MVRFQFWFYYWRADRRTRREQKWIALQDERKKKFMEEWNRTYVPPSDEQQDRWNNRPIWRRS